MQGNSAGIFQGPIKKVAIIGSGVAGLFAAKKLLHYGFDCEIYERDSQVGGVWSVGYHTYGLQTPGGLYDFPDWPMPSSFQFMPTGAELQGHCAAYAGRFGLDTKIRFRTAVTQLERKSEGPGWIVHYRDMNTGDVGHREADFVVMASGLYSNPHIPEFSGRDEFAGQVIHSSEYQAPAQVADRRVVVVGFGKSALDIAVDASKHAREVSLLFRNTHWPVPPKVFGLIDFRKIFFNRLALGFLPLYQRPEPWEKQLHKTAPWLVSGFWRAVEAIVRTQLGLEACQAVPDIPIEHSVFSGGILPTDDTFPRLRSGAIQSRRGSIARFTRDGITLANGDHIVADMVILATGWRCDYSMLPASFQEHIDDDGLYLYRHILHPALPNLAFIGWASTFSNSLTSHLASLWLAHALTGKMSLPSPAEMNREIAALKAWKRSFMPAGSSRGSIIQLHMWHFHDELLRDMGIPTRRKKNPVAEMLADYSPADYADLICDQ